MPLAETGATQVASERRKNWNCLMQIGSCLVVSFGGPAGSSDILTYWLPMCYPQRQLLSQTITTSSTVMLEPEKDATYWDSKAKTKVS